MPTLYEALRGGGKWRDGEGACPPCMRPSGGGDGEGACPPCMRPSGGGDGEGACPPCMRPSGGGEVEGWRGSMPTLYEALRECLIHVINLGTHCSQKHAQLPIPAPSEIVQTP